VTLFNTEFARIGGKYGLDS